MPNSHSELYVHLVWATYDRKPVITPEIEKRLYACITSRCRDMQTHLVAIGGVADHVHVLLRFPATLPISQIAGDLKGASSHLVSKEMGVGEFQWQGAYFARTVSPNAVPAICDYIENQKQHHAQKDLHKQWELADQ